MRYSHHNLLLLFLSFMMKELTTLKKSSQELTIIIKIDRSYSISYEKQLIETLKNRNLEKFRFLDFSNTKT